MFGLGVLFKRLFNVVVFYGSNYLFYIYIIFILLFYIL